MRAFNKREKVLLGILCAIIFGASYYFFFFTPIQAGIAEAVQRTGTAQDQMVIEMTRVTQLNKMKKELEEMKAAGVENKRELPLYNNLDMVMVELNGILLAAKNYKIDFPDPDLSQRIVQRHTNIVFTADNYIAAKAIIQSLSDCAYRCSVDSVNMGVDSSSRDRNTAEDIGAQPVSVSVSVTFFEKNK